MMKTEAEHEVFRDLLVMIIESGVPRTLVKEGIDSHRAAAWCASFASSLVEAMKEVSENGDIESYTSETKEEAHGPRDTG